MSRGKTLRSPERKRRGPPNWLTVIVALAAVGAVYWLQGPADSPWKNPDKIPKVGGLLGEPAKPPAADADEEDSAGEDSPTGDSPAAGATTKDSPSHDSSSQGESASAATSAGSGDQAAKENSRAKGEAGAAGSSSLAASKASPNKAASATGATGATGAKTSKPKKLSQVVKGMKIRDLSGNVVYEGDVDLRETLKRIDAGERFKEFPNDGSVFQNREKRLPVKEREYYREWVHRTPGLTGPGPQRVVTGRAGEAYYTPDHYSRFIKVR